MSKAHQGGQALTELVVSLPVIILCACSVLSLLGVGILRLETLSLSQELRVCYESTHRPFQCRQNFSAALRELPGNWHLGLVQISAQGPRLFLHHSLPGFSSPWVLEP